MRELTNDRDKQPVEPEAQDSSAEQEKNNSKDHRDYVDARLREISAWEVKINGRKKS